MLRCEDSYDDALSQSVVRCHVIMQALSQGLHIMPPPPSCGVLTPPTEVETLINTLLTLEEEGKNRRNRKEEDALN